MDYDSEECRTEFTPEGTESKLLSVPTVYADAIHEKVESDREKYGAFYRSEIAVAALRPRAAQFSRRSIFLLNCVQRSSSVYEKKKSIDCSMSLPQ